jgi:hypothetical protein
MEKEENDTQWSFLPFHFKVENTSEEQLLQKDLYYYEEEVDRKSTRIAWRWIHRAYFEEASSLKLQSFCKRFSSSACFRQKHLSGESREIQWSFCLQENFDFFQRISSVQEEKGVQSFSSPSHLYRFFKRHRLLLEKSFRENDTDLKSVEVEVLWPYPDSEREPQGIFKFFKNKGILFPKNFKKSKLDFLI